MTADALVGAAAGLSRGVRLGGKAIKDGMLLSGGMSVMPMRTGRVWWSVFVRDLHKVLPLLVKYMRCETDSPGVLASCEGSVVVSDTSSVGKSDGGWNDRVLNGLFKMLSSTVAHTYSIKKNELSHIENFFKMMLPVSVVAPRRSFAYETAENLLALVPALIGAPDDTAQRALLDTNSSDWRKAHFSDNFRHLLRRPLVAHHPSHDDFKEEQEVEALMSGSGANAGSGADGGRSTCNKQKMNDRGDSEDNDNQGPGDARAADTSRRSGSSGSRGRSRSSGGSAAGAASSRTDDSGDGRPGARGGPGAQDEDTPGGGRIGDERSGSDRGWSDACRDGGRVGPGADAGGGLRGAGGVQVNQQQDACGAGSVGGGQGGGQDGHARGGRRRSDVGHDRSRVRHAGDVGGGRRGARCGHGRDYRALLGGGCVDDSQSCGRDSKARDVRSQSLDGRDGGRLGKDAGTCDTRRGTGGGRAAKDDHGGPALRCSDGGRRDADVGASENSCGDDGVRVAKDHGVPRGNRQYGGHDGQGAGACGRGPVGDGGQVRRRETSCGGGRVGGGQSEGQGEQARGCRGRSDIVRDGGRVGHGGDARGGRRGARGGQCAEDEDSPGRCSVGGGQSGAHDDQARGGGRRSDDGRDGGGAGQGGSVCDARRGAGGGGGAQDDHWGRARRRSDGARRDADIFTCEDNRGDDGDRFVQHVGMGGGQLHSDGGVFVPADVGYGIRQYVDLNHCAATAAAGELSDTRAGNRSMGNTAGHKDHSVQRSKRRRSGDGRGCLKDALSDHLFAGDSTAAPQADGARQEPRSLQHRDPVVETRVAAQMALGFHPIPTTCSSTVQELGLYGLIRSQAASIRTFGAHVFRIKIPDIRHVPSLAPQRKVGVKVRVRVQTFPQYC